MPQNKILSYIYDGSEFIRFYKAALSPLGIVCRLSCFFFSKTNSPCLQPALGRRKVGQEPYQPFVTVKKMRSIWHNSVRLCQTEPEPVYVYVYCNDISGQWENLGFKSSSSDNAPNPCNDDLHTREKYIKNVYQLQL